MPPNEEARQCSFTPGTFRKSCNELPTQYMEVQAKRNNLEQLARNSMMAYLHATQVSQTCGPSTCVRRIRTWRFLGLRRDRKRF